MTNKLQHTAFYQRVWRWHFFAGLFVAPLAIVLAITGGIYLFSPQINGWFENRINQLPIAAYQDAKQSSPRDIDQVIKDLIDNHPKYRFNKLALAKEDDSTYEVTLQPKSSAHGQAPILVWVNAADGRVIKQQNPDRQITEFVKTVHGDLLSGKAGSLLVELAASWFIILIISGCYLYWPRGQSFGSVFFPSFKNSGGRLTRRVLFRLHGAIAAWASIFILVFLLTGLVWSQVWGEGFKWVQDTAGIPSQSQEFRVTLKSDPQPTIVNKPVSIKTIAAKAKRENLAPPVIVKPPKPGGVWTVRSLHPNRAKRVTLHYDQWTGEQKMRIEFAEKHWFKRLVSHGISLHEGHLFGALNQALGVIIVLAVILLAVTGPLMWWKRRLPGTFSPPSLSVDHRIGKKLACLIIGLAIFLPVAGVSLVIVMLLDQTWARVLTRQTTVSK